MPNYPEYPSATAAICYAHAEAMRRTLGTDHLKWTVDLGKKVLTLKLGSSLKSVSLYVGNLSGFLILIISDLVMKAIF